MKHVSIALCATLAFFACGNDVESVESCGRFEERIEGECVEVSVTGLDARDFSFTRDGYTLHGTLTVPLTAGEYRPPIYVLAHGSGPNDRNQTATGALGVNYGRGVQPFRNLADALGGMGAAVYRYDKRTCFIENSGGACPNSFEDYPGDIDDILVDDYIDDLRAAIRAVGELPGLEESEIVVVGLSQGAQFVPLVLADEPRVVGGVMLGGPAVPVDQAVVGQLREFADWLQANAAASEDFIASVYAEAEKYEEALSRMRAGTFEDESFEGAKVSHWLNWMERTDSIREDFLAVDKPLLVLNGTLDFNVPPHHLERFRQWAEEAGKENVTFGLIPNATHHFVTYHGDDFDYGFSEVALEIWADWQRKALEF